MKILFKSSLVIGLIFGWLFISFSQSTSISPFIPPYPGNSSLFLSGNAQWLAPAGGGGGSGTVGTLINTTATTAGQLVKFTGTDKTNAAPASSSDVAAALPNPITFTEADIGSMVLTNGITNNGAFKQALATASRVAVYDSGSHLTNVVTTAPIDGTGLAASSADLQAALGSVYQATNSTIGSFGVTVDGGGSVPATGVQGYAVAPYAGHITGFSITGNGSSPTCTFDVWKIATGTALPTVTNTIFGTKPALSTGNAVRSISASNWTTNIAAGDIIGFNLDAVTVGTRFTLTLETLH